MGQTTGASRSGPRRTGGAAKAGHDLVIEVESWQATLDPEGQPALTLTADSRSLRVLEGTGGLKSLSESDKADIKKTIDKEVLKGCAIEFRSSEVQRNARRPERARRADAERQAGAGDVRPHDRRRRPCDRQRQGDADRVRDEAVLGAVRGAEGR